MKAGTAKSHSRTPRPLMWPRAMSICLLAVITSLANLAAPARALTISLPTSLVQCQPATIAFGGVSGGSVRLTINSTHSSSNKLDVTVPASQSTYDWNKVDFPAGLTLVIAAQEDTSHQSTRKSKASSIAVAVAHATVSSSQDTSCLSASSSSSSQGTDQDQDSAADDDDAKKKAHDHRRIVLLAAIISTVGAMLLFIAVFVLFVWLRRRKERKAEEAAGYRSDDLDNLSDKVAMSAGWHYMARLVPGLVPNGATPPPSRGRRNHAGHRNNDSMSHTNHSMPLLRDVNEAQTGLHGQHMREHSVASGRWWPQRSTSPEATAPGSGYQSNPPSPEAAHHTTPLPAAVSTSMPYTATPGDEDVFADRASTPNFDQNPVGDAQTGEQPPANVTSPGLRNQVSSRRVSSTARGVAHGHALSASSIRMGPEVPETPTPAT